MTDTGFQLSTNVPEQKKALWDAESSASKNTYLLSQESEVFEIG